MLEKNDLLDESRGVTSKFRADATTFTYYYLWVPKHE